MAETNPENISLYSDKSIIYDERPKVHRRIVRKKLSYIEPLDEPGTIYNAEVHQSAQRLLKVHRITKYVKFCNCCALPQETPGVVVPFNLFDKKIDFGLGIFLYFYYIKFCIIISFICIGLSSISTIIFSQNYANDIKNYCNKIINENIIVDLEGKNNNIKSLIERCYKYIDIDDNIIEKYSADVDDIVKLDWMNKMSTYNIKFYYEVFKYGATESQYKNIESITLNFSLMYFITMITMLIINYIFILHINLLDLCENFKITTPSDYALVIHGVPKPENEEGKIKDELIKIVKEVSNDVPNLDIYQIIPCLRIVEIYEIAQKKYEYKKILYHLENFELQKALNRENGFNKNEMWNNLHYFKKYLFFNKKIPYQEIENEFQNYSTKLDNMLIDLNKNPNKYNGGTFILIFSTMNMREKFYDYFPNSFCEKLYWSLKYFFENIICGKCMNDGQKKISKLKMDISVKKADEPYEIVWENMGYTRMERNVRKLLSSLSSLFLIAITFGIIVLINWGQRIISEKEENFWSYVLSLSVSVIIAITNYIAKFILKKLTLIEKKETKTDFIKSYSMKLTVFNFVTIAIIPVVSNFIHGEKWGDSDVLVNNLLMIFIMNIIFPPVLFYLGPDLAIKIYKRTKARLELEDIKYEKSTYTQGELNEIFENPEMDICSKYSFISNAVLIPLFFMSIFPIGMIFGFFGLLFTFISEFFYVGLYKRPEVLNSKLCKFYIYNFKWSIFIFSLGNYIFLSPISKSHRLNWSLINLILLFVLCLIPYETIRVKTIDISESESKRDTYKDSYIYFSTDYEKLCPFTRKTAYINYFQKLVDDKIINRFYGAKIILNIQNKNEMTEFIKTKRHLDYYVASQQLNNIYTKNKNLKIIKYIFGDEQSENDNKSLTLSRLKSIILTSSYKTEANCDYNSIRQMKDLLYSFYTTTAGISNALIFLDEKRSIINNLDFYNYNPWKADWIYTKAYKKERSDMIHKIRKEMDYKGEVSDDEDSIIKYDETQDQLNEQIRKFNRRSIAFEAKPNAKDQDKPMINNSEIITGKINKNNDEDSNSNDDDLSKKILEFRGIRTIRSIYSKSEKGKKVFNNRNINDKMPYYNIVLNNKDFNENKNNINNNSNMNYINTQSQINLVEDNSLFQKKDMINNFNNNK